MFARPGSGPGCLDLVRFSHRLGESIRKPLWTHGVASKVLRPRFNRAQKTTPVVQMKKPICTTASARAFLIGDEKCGLADGRGVQFPGPDPDALRKVQHENLAVPHRSGLCALDDGFNRGFDKILVQDQRSLEY